MAQKKKSKLQEKTEENRLNLFREVLANQRKSEKEKQKQIYGAMKGIQKERQG